MEWRKISDWDGQGADQGQLLLSTPNLLITYFLLYSRDPTGLFVAAIIVCLVVFLSICALIWETLRKIRKRASGKGWRQLQTDKEERAAFRNSNGGQGMPLERFYEPRQGQLYDPPRAGAGGPVMMRQGGMAPPPIPPMPRQYQRLDQQPEQRPNTGQWNPAAVAPFQPPAGTPSAPRRDLQDVVYQSTLAPTRENSQVEKFLSADSTAALLTYLTDPNCRYRSRSSSALILHRTATATASPRTIQYVQTYSIHSISPLCSPLHPYRNL